MMPLYFLDLFFFMPLTRRERRKLKMEPPLRRGPWVVDPLAMRSEKSLPKAPYFKQELGPHVMQLKALFWPDSLVTKEPPSHPQLKSSEQPEARKMMVR